MLRKLFSSLIVAGFLLAGPADAAVTDGDFVLSTTQNLVNLCSVGMGAADGAGLGATGGFLLGQHNEAVNKAYEQGRASASQGR